MTIPPEQASSTSCSPFRYDGATIRALSATISKERFATYLRIGRGDRRRALQLYAYNAALGSAFHGPLQALEVTLRNAVHDAMTASHNGFWFDGPLIRDAEREAIDKATKSLQREGKPRTPGDVVAALNLGFWVALFKRKYDATLWRTVLHQSFNPTPSRFDLHEQLGRLRTLRNRIVHHEPILQRNLHADHNGILWVLNMLSAETATWVEYHSRVQEELARSSHTIVRF